MDVSTVRSRLEPGAERRLRIAIDAMGGDHAPMEVVEGSLAWASSNPDTDLILVGDAARIDGVLAGRRTQNIEVIHASENVEMEEHPAASVRRKRDASINVCMRLVREGRADAVMSAGHTGASVAAAILGLGRLPGVDRPALAVQMVTDKGPFVLLDIGATTDSSGHNLAQYARMGAIFSEQGPRAHRRPAIDRRGRRQRGAARPGCLDPHRSQRPAFRGQCRGQGSRRPPGRCGRL